MSNNKASAQAYDDIICEAIGCYSNATNTIELKIGPNRTISLFLCSNCRLKLCLDECTVRDTTT